MPGLIIPGGIVHPTVPTAQAGNNTTLVANTEFVTGVSNLKAPIISPNFSGTPRSTTAIPTDASTRIATTEWVQQYMDSVVPPPTIPTMTVSPNVTSGSTGNQLQLSGSVGATGEAIDYYRIIDIQSPGFVFSKTDNIAENEIITFTAPAVSANTTIAITAIAVKGTRNSAPRITNILVNIVPSVIGEPFGGGFFAGKIQVGAAQYALILSPKAQGENTTLQFKADDTTSTGTDSLNDGFANTNAMNNASHPLAQWARTRSIGGQSDWYIAARDEWEAISRNLKPTTAANSTGARIGGAGGTTFGTMGENANSVPSGQAYVANIPQQTAATIFKSGGAESLSTNIGFWTSSQVFNPTTGTWMEWYQLATNLSQSAISKSSPSIAMGVRVIRRIRIN